MLPCCKFIGTCLAHLVQSCSNDIECKSSPSISPCLTWAVEAVRNLCAGSPGEAGRRLQPYTDHLVYSAAVALPWLAPELQHLESPPEGLTALESSIEQYLSLRQQPSQQALNPFPVHGQQDDAAVVSLTGNGVSAFLPQVGDAVGHLDHKQDGVCLHRCASPSFGLLAYSS